ncbi:glutathione S-transferase [Xylariales sp. AK1849]|nr:glutathione S-transferase [Xylariales sp. AK1849]
MAPSDLPIILYHYPSSPYARRIVWYLTLRGIPYSQCMQPPMLPRPDLTALGISYRRIPLLSIGRDVYVDTRLILQKLEQFYPPSTSHPSISASTGDAQALERLLSHFIIDGGIFMRAASLLPPDLPIMKNAKFVADRADLAGVPPGTPSPFSKEALDARRPEALSEIRDAVVLLETTLLADGRDWALKTDGPSLADIEAVWPFHWLNGLPGALPENVVSAKQFPKVFAWIERFSKVMGQRSKQVDQPRTLNGEEAAKLVVTSAFAEDEGDVDGSEVYVTAEALKSGDTVKVWPTDTGASHKDTGKLLAATSNQVVVEIQGQAGGVRLHAPRHGFKVRKVTEGNSKL